MEFVVAEQVLTEYGICYMTNNFLTKQLSTRYYYGALASVLKLLFRFFFSNFSSMLILGKPANSPFAEKYYQNAKLHQVVSGNLFDGDLNYNFVGFVDEIMVCMPCFGSFYKNAQFSEFQNRFFYVGNIKF